jgi:lipoyl(octanoyl) transferase
MHSPLYPNFTVKSYAGHLEATTQRVLYDLFGITTYIDDAEPGVWVAGSNGQEDRKIAALGVHQRRYVTSLGLALNVDIAVRGETNVNSWKRFVPCGIEGKGVTSVAAETNNDESTAWDLEDISKRWAQVFQNGLVDPSLRTFTHSR